MSDDSTSERFSSNTFTSNTDLKDRPFSRFLGIITVSFPSSYLKCKIIPLLSFDGRAATNNKLSICEPKNDAC